jgi:hypothetical protein
MERVEAQDDRDARRDDVLAGDAAGIVGRDGDRPGRRGEVSRRVRARACTRDGCAFSALEYLRVRLEYSSVPTSTTDPHSCAGYVGYCRRAHAYAHSYPALPHLRRRRKGPKAVDPNGRHGSAWPVRDHPLRVCARARVCVRSWACARVHVCVCEGGGSLLGGGSGSARLYHCQYVGLLPPGRPRLLHITEPHRPRTLHAQTCCQAQVLLLCGRHSEPWSRIGLGAVGPSAVRFACIRFSACSACARACVCARSGGEGARGGRIAKVRCATGCMPPTESGADVAAMPVKQFAQHLGASLCHSGKGGNAYFGSATTCGGVIAGGPIGCCSSALPCGSATPGYPMIVAAPHHSSHGRHAVQQLCDYSRCTGMGNANIKAGSHACGGASNHLLQRLGSWIWRVDMRLRRGSPLNGPSSS